jgi:hypothetical protein
VKLAKEKSVTTKSVRRCWTWVEVCGVGVPLPISNLAAVKESN